MLAENLNCPLAAVEIPLLDSSSLSVGEAKGRCWSTVLGRTNAQQDVSSDHKERRRV